MFVTLPPASDDIGPRGERRYLLQAVELKACVDGAVMSGDDYNVQPNQREAEDLSRLENEPIAAGAYASTFLNSAGPNIYPDRLYEVERLDRAADKLENEEVYRVLDRYKRHEDAGRIAQIERFGSAEEELARQRAVQTQQRRVIAQEALDAIEQAALNQALSDLDEALEVDRMAGPEQADAFFEPERNQQHKGDLNPGPAAAWPIVASAFLRAASTSDDTRFSW